MIGWPRFGKLSTVRRARTRDRAPVAPEPLERRTLFAVTVLIEDAGPIVEADGGTSNASFRVRLTEPVGVLVSVDYATSGGGAALEHEDYVPTNGTLTFAPGELEKTIAVPVVGDVIAEDAETFTVSLTGTSGADGVVDGVATAMVLDTDETGVIDAVDDLVTSTAGQPITINVISNDRGIDPATSAVAILAQPAVPVGAVAVNPDNTITFTPGVDTSGIARFTYRLASGTERNTGQVTIVPAGVHVEADPLDPSLTALVVAGDGNANTFRFRKRPGGQVQVSIDRVVQGTVPAPTGRIVIVGGDGNDIVSAPGTRHPLGLYGGAGDDRITGGRLNDVLIGGDGNDTLNGGGGRDLLVGGTGADTFNGAGDDDIVIAGASAYDADSDTTRAALRDLLGTWSDRGGTQAARVAAIRSADGIGDSGAALNASTVYDDADPDTLTGTFGQDALYANLSGGSATDVLRGRRINGNGIGAVSDLSEWMPDRSVRLHVSAQQVGVTPQLIGFNQGYYLPGSSTSGWVDYSQLNAFRVWTSPNDFEPENSETFGDGIVTLEDFEARKSAVRANPEGNGFIPWDVYNDRFENLEITGRNTSKLNYMLGELTSRGIEVIMQITRSENYPFNGWDGAYEQWQHFYAMAYHAAKNYDVTRFQMYNEPDQSNATITQDEWRQRLKLASDAVKSAIEDVNRDFGKSLVPDVSAPVVKLGAESALTWDEPGSVDWGKQALIENRTDYAGRAVDYDIFNTYDMHRYADSRPLSWYTDDGEILRSEIPQYNASGQMMPFTYTEYNRRSTAGFNNRPAESLDTPQMYTEFGLINLLAMAQDVSGMYAFKFNQTDFSGSPQKTGFYYVSEEGLLDTTGATRSAGVQRLFAKGFKGALPRFATADAVGAGYESAASYDALSGTYSLMGINLSDTDPADLTIDLGEWNIPPGTAVTIEEVSQRHHGEVVQTVTVPASGRISVNQPARSVWLLRIPAAADLQTTLLPSEDAQVHNADPTNFGGGEKARVARSAIDTNDFATYLKFDLGSIPASDVSRAILQVTGQTVVAPSPSVLHVYALTNDAWSENGITWANAPNLGGADSRVSGVGTTATPVGHLTFDGTSSTTGIDLTEYLRGHPDGVITLAIVREERFTGDADGNAVEIFTRESPTGQPTLTIYQLSREG